MSAGGYQVIPDELRNAAVIYKAQADALAQALARFSSAWRLSDSTFGRLPNARALALNSQEFRNQVGNQLRKIHDELLTEAAKLAAFADGYQAADEAAVFCPQPLSVSGARASGAAARPLSQAEEQPGTPR